MKTAHYKEGENDKYSQGMSASVEDYEIVGANQENFSIHEDYTVKSFVKTGDIVSFSIKKLTDASACPQLVIFEIGADYALNYTHLIPILLNNNEWVDVNENILPGQQVILVEDLDNIRPIIAKHLYDYN